MATRYIYLDHELNEKLKEEENASGLIVNLLNKHYKDFGKTEEQIIQEVKDLIKEKEDKQANHDKYNNPKYIAKREKEMEKAKIERDIIKAKEQKERERRNAK